MSDALKPLISKAADMPLSRAEAEDAFEILFEGAATPAQIGGFLMALRTRGETVDEFAAAASVMRAKCNRVNAPKGAMDIVGTGGDGKGTLNISTACALVVAGAGVVVAKHGNRNLSSKSGAADILNAKLGKKNVTYFSDFSVNPKFTDALKGVKIANSSNIDVILVGDSASNVIAGNETTLPITLDEMIYHAKSVVKGVDRALVVVDLPFGSYQSDPKKALRSAIRIMKESGAHAVKLEGGQEVIESIERIIKAGIPVMGHLGLTPQSIYKFGTYSVRAKEKDEAMQLLSDAKALEDAGCFATVLEKIPSKLAKKVTKLSSIPLIGIGAGNQVDGQVLVLHDLLGLTHEFNPRFLRRYLDLNKTVENAVSNYINDVKNLDFPNENEMY